MTDLAFQEPNIVMLVLGVELSLCSEVQKVGNDILS